MKKFKRYTVTAALPYANGPLHIGHIAGAYLPSDTYVRYLRLKGVDVVYVCGSDEHGVAITLGAKKEGLTPKAYVDKYHNIMKKAFEDFGISFDIYSRTSNEVHYKMSQDFFLKVHAQNLFTKKRLISTMMSRKNFSGGSLYRWHLPELRTSKCLWRSV
jgi:methionyl-tRNA synthetase